MHADVSELAVSMPEAARRLGVSARTVANLIARGELQSCKVGRRRVIPVAALEGLIKSGNNPQRSGT